MFFEENNSELQQSRNNFSDEVRDIFGNSICEELYDKLTNCLSTAEHMCDGADMREAVIKAMLLELRLIL